MNDDAGELKFSYHQVDAMIRYLALDCFGCNGRFSPDYASIPFRTSQTPSKELQLVPGDTTFGNWALYRMPGEMSLFDFLKAADAEGWRKITMYGRTVYICPQCRETHKRSRPEWERRLV